MLRIAIVDVVTDQRNYIHFATNSKFGCDRDNTVFGIRKHFQYAMIGTKKAK